MKRAVTSFNNMMETRPIMTKMVTTGALFGIADMLSQQIEKSAAKKGASAGAAAASSQSQSAALEATKKIGQNATNVVQPLKESREVTAAKTAAMVKSISLKQKMMAFFQLDVLRLKRMVFYGSVFSAPTGHVIYSKILPYLVPHTSLRGILLKVGLDAVFVTATTLSMFFYFFSRIEGKSHQEGIDKVKLMLIPSLIAGMKVWPSLQVINFKFVPISMQLLFVSFVNIFWVAYLSYVNARKQRASFDLRQAEIQRATVSSIETYAR